MDNQPPPEPQNNPALFPTLTAAQLQRIAACGTTRNVAAGTTVVEQGDATMPFIVVLSGELEIVRPAPGGDEVVAVHKAGNFFGDIVMLSGRRSMVIARMRVAGQLIEMQREALQQLVQTDGELGAQFEGNGIYYGATHYISLPSVVPPVQHRVVSARLQAAKDAQVRLSEPCR
jgi:CRP-like cAMP-binding protein